MEFKMFFLIRKEKMKPFQKPDMKLVLAFVSFNLLPFVSINFSPLRVDYCRSAAPLWTNLWHVGKIDRKQDRFSRQLSRLARPVNTNSIFEANRFKSEPRGQLDGGRFLMKNLNLCTQWGPEEKGVLGRGYDSQSCPSGSRR